MCLRVTCRGRDRRKEIRERWFPGQRSRDRAQAEKVFSLFGRPFYLRPGEEDSARAKALARSGPWDARSGRRHRRGCTNQYPVALHFENGFRAESSPDSLEWDGPIRCAETLPPGGFLLPPDSLYQIFLSRERDRYRDRPGRSYLRECCWRA